ncbi:MAG: DUF805 domain-containing protein [Leptospiraceae bacterium]|nr:DUF805 domain-containing protein [Leptospiraceae bacterium]
MSWYLKVLKQYVDFNGRARRKEYWMFYLFNMIFSVVAATLDNMLGLTFVEGVPYGFLYLAYILAVMLPALGVTIRRLHDTGKSGWMFLVVFIPLAGPIWLLVLMVLEGTQGDNEYGPDPKAGAAA